MEYRKRYRALYRFYSRMSGAIVAHVPQLSQREIEVARLVAEGLTNRQIAERLFLSERTAEYHVEQIRNKLGFHARSEIARWVTSQRSARQLIGYLPSPLTTLIGRARETDGVIALLRRIRLVTIAGAPGVGKTRLSVEVADRLRSDFPDGVWFVDLQGISDQNLVAAELAGTLGTSDFVRDLARKRLLVLLDNCEHLISACSNLAEQVLGACPELRLLATSRQPLHAKGEAVWQLEPLPRREATELFLDRARLAAPDIDLATADQSVLESICTELDGIPLAIELAAARTRVMSLADIRERLQHRFSLLKGDNASGGRQSTLESAVAWSYELLSGKEQLLFRRLGTFAGTFLLESAIAIVSDSELPAEDLPELVDRLVDRSIVIAERDPNRQTGYRLLVTLREYARDRIRREGALERLRQLHARYYRHLAEQAGAELQGPRQSSWHGRIEAELDEIRAALEWSLVADPETAVAITGELVWFWGLRGRVDEGRKALTAALTVAPQRTVARARALIGAGWLARQQGAFTVGATFHAESVDILREFDDPIELGQALVWNAEAASSLGDWVAARAGWQEAIDLVQSAGPSEPLANALLELAYADARDGLLPSARQRAAQALEMHIQLGNPRGAAMGQVVAAYVEHLDGNSVGAWNGLTASLRMMLAAAAIADLRGPLSLAVVLIVSAGGPMAKAVTVGGAAAAARIASGLSLEYGSWPVESSHLEVSLDIARKKLGQEKFGAAWQEGLGMSTEQAVALALG